MAEGVGYILIITTKNGRVLKIVAYETEIKKGFVNVPESDPLTTTRSTGLQPALSVEGETSDIEPVRLSVLQDLSLSKWRFIRLTSAGRFTQVGLPERNLSKNKKLNRPFGLRRARVTISNRGLTFILRRCVHDNSILTEDLYLSSSSTVFVSDIFNDFCCSVHNNSSHDYCRNYRIIPHYSNSAKGG